MLTHLIAKEKMYMRNIMRSLMMGLLVLTLALPMQSFAGEKADMETAGIIRTQAVRPVKLSRKKLELKVGQKKQLFLRNAAGKITWKSKDSDIAKVGRKGVVRARKSGKTTIVAKFAGKKYKCKVHVIADRSPNRTSDRTSGNTGSGNTGSSAESNRTGTVYWTPSGSVYHYSRSCPTLSRSRTVYSGSVSESGKSRGCKVCG